MTIINTEEELEQMTKRWELDIELWNTYTFREVYEHLYSKDKKVNYV